MSPPSGLDGEPALQAVLHPSALREEETWSGYFSQDFYHSAIPPLLAGTVVLSYFSRPSTRGEIFPPGFHAFERVYFLVWALCAAADWLQGPYTYALYEAYGFSSAEIAQLFVVGYGSSLVFGCFVGSFTDRFGRKKCCILYCVLYCVSCLTKHFNMYLPLMLGRITGGIATSLLNSCFECWMVSEHVLRRRFPESLLGYMFSMMYTVMYSVAIASGLAGQAVVDKFKFAPLGGSGSGSIIYVGGFCCPFDLSIVCTVVSGVLIAVAWEENYGSQEPSSQNSSSGVVQNLRAACSLIVSDRQVLVLGLVVATFEGSMYAWVFNWTPALENSALPPPHGVIFALFMMSCMCGASVSMLFGRWLGPRVSLLAACCASLVCFAVSACIGGGHTQVHLQATLMAFIVYEFCVGVYFPSIGTLKSEIVPEELRGTVYNLYRMPLNAIVVGLLLKDIPAVTCFKINALLMAVAVVSLCMMPSSLPFKKVSDMELGRLQRGKVAAFDPSEVEDLSETVGRQSDVGSPSREGEVAVGRRHPHPQAVKDEASF